MKDKKYHVLFLCSGNSVRSIFAEALLNRLGGERFLAFSAGSHPESSPHPLTLEVLSAQNIDISGLYCKNMALFTTPEAPLMDFIFTLCDKTAGEICPQFPGNPITAHWGFEDPFKFEGSHAAIFHSFKNIEKQIATRLRLFLSLPLEKIDRISLQTQLKQLGRQ